MLIVTTIKIIFLLINHLVAAHTPPRAIFPSDWVHEAPGTGFLEISKWRVLPTYDAGLGLVPRKEGDGGSCDRRAKCKKKKIRNPADDSKCIRCPPLMKADPTSTLCVRDNDVSEEDKRKQYEEKIKEKIKKKFDKFKEKIKERLEKNKEVKNKEWEEKDKLRQDKRNQKIYRREAVCVPAVAASIGTIAMLELADGGFSEDLFDSIDGDMLQFWPSNDITDDWLDNALPDDESDITNEDYVNEFLVVGDAASGNSKRSIEKGDIHSTAQANSENSELSNEKRNIFTAIANAFRALGRAIAAAATRRAGGGKTVARATRYFSDGKKPNLKKPGETKLSRAEQKDKAKEISQNKNWTKCLRGEKPEK
ncbi:uncharacterized protein K460DRAFT_290687 [Cucurbitaria berberidis CBS 394.84]|uniref:Secreted protein n=1 Tax=Cucurbitaria berberidis CBS 394.84 TaxID=1168544 RepID=A0A9P4GD07_9PLEO|nr:uncharacterized protein K460DRAFT_290687 [Cucurbitaria berberidis CBS 394.84]KAF1842950.1 hypothetical protein K460DRAFT_290687 [Cucurbitaria berberidis CBS 394.84]